MRIENRGVGLQQYLIEYVFVEVGHVAMIWHRAIVIILEMFLQGNRIMWDVQDSVQVVRKHLRRRRLWL